MIIPVLRTDPGQRCTGGTRNLREARRPRKRNHRRCKHTFSCRFTTFFLIFQTVPADTGEAQLAAVYPAAAF